MNKIVWRPDTKRNGAYGDVNGIEIYHVYEQSNAWHMFVELPTNVLPITGSVVLSDTDLTIEDMQELAFDHLREVRRIIEGAASATFHDTAR